MQCVRITDLGCKEVINICDGTRYGYVNDVEIDTSSGEVVSLIVPCRRKFPWISLKREEYIIPWTAIRRVGDDIILVDHQLNIASRGKKRTWFAL